MEGISASPAQCDDNSCLAYRQRSWVGDGGRAEVGGSASGVSVAHPGRGVKVGLPLGHLRP